MELKRLWQEKQYNEIYRIVQSKRPEEIEVSERVICAEVMLRNERKQQALAFFEAADRRDMTEEQCVHYAVLLAEQNKIQQAYELLVKTPCNGFEALYQRYKLQKKLNKSEEERLESLVQLLEISYQEDLLYDQAVLYYKAGQNARGKRACKQLISYFKTGEWTEKAQALMDDPEAVIRSMVEDTAADAAEDTYTPVYVPETKQEPISVLPVKPERVTTEVQMPPERKAADEKETYPEIIAQAFEGMVGMDSVKKELTGFYNMICLQNARKETLGITDDSTRAYNFVLYGNPGTGKTTVPRIIAKVLYA